ncbi:MAG: ComF family protein [Candidatus Adiutrix sp.]|jgi:ComF family protein|nr:ComF family protein [Candidatus Adiutrix sp.]
MSVLKPEAGSVLERPPAAQRSRWAELLRSLGDLLWPPVCATCPRALPLAADERDPAAHFCPDCLAELEFMPESLCPLCGRPYFQAGPHLCGDCLRRPPAYDTARSALVYQGTAARSIALLKYHGDLSQIGALAELSSARLAPPEGPARADPDVYDFIVPMPISPGRLRRRGFNQAAELAKAIYRPWRKKLDEKLLIRPGDGLVHQAALSGAERRRAVRGCFKIPEPSRVKGAAILLFDDVLTTGATAEEAARTLLTAGARRVDLHSTARTVLQDWR